MAAGFQVFNDSNVVQVDETFSCYHEIQRGYLPTPVQEQSYSSNGVDGNSINAAVWYPSNDFSSLVFVRPATNVWVSPCHMPPQGHTGIHIGNSYGYYPAGKYFIAYNCGVSGYQGYDSNMITAPSSTKYVVYNNTKANQFSSNYGIQVFDATGNLIFSSARPTLNTLFHAKFSINSFGTWGHTNDIAVLTYNMPRAPRAGHEYYFCLNSIYGLLTYEGSSQDGQLSSIFARQTSSTQFQVSHRYCWAVVGNGWSAVGYRPAWHQFELIVAEVSV